MLGIRLLCLLAGTFLVSAPSCEPLSPPSAPVVGRYKMLELVFTASVSPDNPFDTYLLKLEVTDPRGRSFPIEGFYDGDGRGGQNGVIWKARMCPYEAGEWTWHTVPGDQPDPALSNLQGTFSCVDAGDLGGVVRQDAHFRFENGDPIYLVGNFLDFAGGLSTTHTYMSEMTTDGDRDELLTRQRDFHTANKANFYFANQGDYDSESVTPWLGTAGSNDKTRMDLARWNLYDGHIVRLKNNRMLASMWFFADDSGFGDLADADRHRLFRYAMARTSAFTHTMYVISLEYQEGWSQAEVSLAGIYLQKNNPWRRMISVHTLEQSDWSFTGETWPDWIASQGGNDAGPSDINAYARAMRAQSPLPHVDEEFGILNGDTDARLRANLWANLCGGAAGGGTGSDLKALQNFLAQSRVPFQRMMSANDLVDEGGERRFCLAEIGEHYLVYDLSGSFALTVAGDGLSGRWFNPRDPHAELGEAFPVSSGRGRFGPPSKNQDWVLWITSENNLLRGVTRPSGDAEVVRVIVES